MSAVSYKELLTNMLIVFINQRIQESKDIADKVEALEETKRKKLHDKVVNYVISKAKGLAELQGTQYLGVEDKTVVNWINNFFDEFEENMKEPEKPKTTTPTTTRTSIATKPEASTFKTEDGLFGLEIAMDKKIKVNKEDFIKKMEKLYKDEVVEFEWKEEEVIVKHHKQGEAKEVTQQEKDNEEIQEIDDDETTSEDDEPEDDESEDDEPEETEEKVEVKPVVKEVKPKKEKVVKEPKPKAEKEEKPKVEEPEEEDAGLFDL